MNYIVALGGNLGEPHSTFEAALGKIAVQIGSVLRQSAWYVTPALLHPDNLEPQADYLNGVILVESSMSAADALAQLLDIERQLGRDRATEKTRWAPRLIDLDLIAAEGQVLKIEGLTLPHPEMHRRQFVLEPLADILPGWCHPILGKTVLELLAEARKVDS